MKKFFKSMTNLRNYADALSAPFQVIRLYHVLKKIVYQKKVLIIGSGPNLTNIKSGENTVVISVNASAANLQRKMDISPNITFLENELIDMSALESKPSRKVIIDKKLLKNRDLGLIISASCYHGGIGNPEILESFYDKHIYINRISRNLIIWLLTGSFWDGFKTKNLMSSGCFASALAAFGKPSCIVLEGFSIYSNIGDKKHFFTQSDNNQKLKGLEIRRHVAADLNFWTKLVMRGKKIKTSEPQIALYLRNDKWIKSDDNN